VTIEVTAITVYFFILGVVSGFFSGYTVKDLMIENLQARLEAMIKSYNELYIQHEQLKRGFHERENQKIHL